MKEGKMLMALHDLVVQQKQANELGVQKIKEKRKALIKKYIKKYGANKTLLQLVKDALIENGGNYEAICMQLETIEKFIEMAKDIGVNVDFSKIDVAYADFFKGNDKILDIDVDEDFNRVSYHKEYMKHSGSFAMGTARSYKSKKRYGMYIAMHEETGKPVLYFGHFKDNFATFDWRDTYLMFLDNEVKFVNDEATNYDEFRLSGDGGKAEFTFDESNRLIKVLCVGKICKGLFYSDKGQRVTFDDFESTYNEWRNKGKVNLIESSQEDVKELPEGKII